MAGRVLPPFAEELVEHEPLAPSSFPLGPRAVLPDRKKLLKELVVEVSDAEEGKFFDRVCDLDIALRIAIAAVLEARDVLGEVLPTVRGTEADESHESDAPALLGPIIEGFVARESVGVVMKPELVDQLAVKPIHMRLDVRGVVRRVDPDVAYVEEKNALQLSSPPCDQRFEREGVARMARIAWSHGSVSKLCGKLIPETVVLGGRPILIRAAKERVALSQPLSRPFLASGFPPNGILLGA